MLRSFGPNRDVSPCGSSRDASPRVVQPAAFVADVRVTPLRRARRFDPRTLLPVERATAATYAAAAGLSVVLGVVIGRLA